MWGKHWQQGSDAIVKFERDCVLVGIFKVYYYTLNTEIRLIIFFAAENGEALYSQQKQDWELTVAQITNFLLQNSDLN